VILTPPGGKNWRGVCAHKGITYTALQEAINRSRLKWMEKVSHEQYNEVVKTLK
jgi:hypothetical protein